jgi:hypothetical protein
VLGVFVLVGVFVGVIVLVGVKDGVLVFDAVMDMVGVMLGVMDIVGVMVGVGVGVVHSISTVTPIKNCSLVILSYNGVELVELRYMSNGPFEWDAEFNCKKYLEQAVIPVMIFSTLFSHIGSCIYYNYCVI